MATKSENRRINLYINGKEVKNNIRSIRNEYFKLINSQSRMTRGSKEYYAAAKNIKKLKGLMNEHNKQLGRMGKAWMNLKTLIFGVVGGNLITSMFQKITSFIPDMVKRNGDLSDSYADVAKTTNLTIDEVRDLSKELKKIDTRSSRKELLDLARIAGKLGVRGKADIIGFVKAADQINVALSEDLGGNAAEAIRQLGKLTDVFKLKDKYGLEKSLLKTGSAINALGAASTANEAFLVEFTKRVAGVAPMADISIESVLGLAATLDQLGQTSEVSSTVFSQVIPNMFKDTATYAGVAGMEVGEFSKLLKTDANEAFIKVLEGLNGNNAGMETMVKKLDELGLGGKRTISVLGVLSNNTKMLRDQQKLANDEFEKGTSLTNEFNIKNNTLGANLAKIGKKLAGIFVNSKLVSGIEGVVNMFAKWIEIPVSKQLEDQRVKTNLFAIELTNSNTTAQRRNDIYKELQGINPKIVEGIDSENISVEKLRLNLARYNDEMIKKIAIQESEEVLQERRQEFGEKIGERLKAENELIKELYNLSGKVSKHDESRAKKISDILLSDQDILNKEIEIRDIVQDLNKELGSNHVIVTRAYNKAYEVKNLKDEELELQKELNTALQEYQDIYNRIFGNTTDGGPPPPKPPPPGGGGFDDLTFGELEGADDDKLTEMEALAASEIKIHSNKLDQIELRNDQYGSAIAEKEKWLTNERLEQINIYGNSAMRLIGAIQMMQMSAMTRELKAAGDNEKEKDRIRKEYAEKQQTMAILQAIINTALGVTSALTLPPPASYVAAAITAIAGAVEIATISAQQFASGNYQDIIGASDGKRYRAKVVDRRHRSGLYNEPTYLPGFGLFGDTGPESELVFNPDDTNRILNNRALTNEIINTLGSPQFASGNSREIIRESTTRETYTDSPALMAMLERLIDKLDEPLKAELNADENYIDTHKDVIAKHDKMLDNVNG